MTVKAFIYQVIALKATDTGSEMFLYLGGSLIAVIVAALIMQFFIYKPIMERLKNVKPEKQTPFFENEAFYAQYVVWCSENGYEPHFLKREVAVSAIYDDEDDE